MKNLSCGTDEARIDVVKTTKGEFIVIILVDRIDSILRNCTVLVSDHEPTFSEVLQELQKQDTDIYLAIVDVIEHNGKVFFNGVKINPSTSTKYNYTYDYTKLF